MTVLKRLEETETGREGLERSPEVSGGAAKVQNMSDFRC